MVGYKYLSFKVNELWNLSVKCNILDLGCDYFLFKFENPADYRFALLEGPWFIGGHHLSIRRWTPNFKPSEDSVNTTVVWARLLELPLEYFDKAVLERIGQKIGRLIKVDNTTNMILRGKFARVCVEVSTDEPLLPFIKIGSVKQKIEYEGVNLICFHCGKMSHKKENCPLVTDANNANNSDHVINSAKMTNNVFKPAHVTGTVNSAITEESFGPWMLVEKKKNKIRVAGARVANQKVQDNSRGVSNRFASLDEQNSFDQTDLNIAHQRSINA
ncbi:uncharacterized protein LOC113280040 [Papaver somniferum]|uniref:uncharacterized protein LOC113280040 n=1 Tax=Papaver somniferum TaxID=3469 RepID=UPI000E700D6B|nr:uncharacterized protein LOC113280040 [Papaver somniferum]